MVKEEELTPLRLITIIAETMLEDRITRRLMEWGATGYTVTQITGKGSRGIRTGDIPGEGVRIEAIVDSATADRILDGIRDRYFENFAVITWVTEVGVIRGEKYLRG